ncbi:heavy metal translocating P-type ATPase [Actinomycetospora callitridis]|uniref:heavy metal translocating P-type ATPase n=1 Tax=Actinomycetospora callitridis TaxID=913944 RepID=UPI0023656E74|nr:heavy metal translocating P-type ATPase [Actinomycetospora callitridis]MDD7918236.1 heavy metal translocating P-type ATPase [Actinomycetospora callitridis]
MATDVADSTAAASAETVTTELAVTGMTCGTCAARIQRKLGRLPGVEASVNYATGRARVTHPPEQDTDELVAAVRTLGFGATAAQPLVPAGGGVPAPRTAPESAPRPTSSPTTATKAEEAPDPELSELRHRALVCLALTLPVMAVAMNPDWQFRYWQWFCLVLTAPVVIWGGYRFHKAAARHLRHLSATMDTLVSVGTLAAFGWSLWTLFFGGAGLGGMRHALYLIPRPDQFDGSRTVYLEAAAAITTAALLGRWIELRGRRRALGVSSSLMAPPATEARVVVGDRELPVPVAGVQPGDRIAVGAGEPFPLDGRVVEGRSTVDAGAMTGESAPVDVEPGTEVLAGTRNETARLVVETTRAAGDTQWARMARRVEEAQAGKTAIQRLADRISAWFVPVVILVAINTLLFWGVSGAGWGFAVAAGMAVLVVACPCALGLATPTALAVATGRGAQLGILLRGPEVLESTRRVDTIVLDKTGTVTTGRMTLQTLRTTDGVGRDEVLARAGALEARLEHPVARAIAAAARDEVASISAEVTDVAPLDGLGVVGTVDGVRVLAGRHRLFVERGVDVPADLQRALDDAAARGATTVLVAWDDESGVLRARAVLAVADGVREGSKEAVAQMRASGLRPVLLTGDNPAAARAVAAEVGIDAADVVAEVLPTEKADEVRRLQEGGATVAMVGDGVNDAAALAQADLGVAMGTGTAMAIEAGDVTLVRDDLRAVPVALRLARRTLSTIRGNLFWAFAYNVAALPLAVAGLLNPMIAGVTMALSSVFVVGNSLRLRRFTP